MVFYLAVASLVMPSLLVGFGIGLGFQFLGWQPSLFTSALGAQLTWTLPFGLFAMFAVVNRFNRAWEEAARDLGASPWQVLRHITIPILLPGIIGVAMGAFTLSYDEYARTTLTIGPKNTLPLEIYALISSATSPTLFAIGTVTTAVSFLAITVSLLVVMRIQSRRDQSVGKGLINGHTLRRRTGFGHQALRHDAGRGRNLVAYPSCVVLLPAGSQRLRKDHDPADDRGARGCVGWRCPDPRRRTCPTCRRCAAARR